MNEQQLFRAIQVAEKALANGAGNGDLAAHLGLDEADVKELQAALGEVEAADSHSLPHGWPYVDGREWFAASRWSIGDVQTLRPHWSDEQARAFLVANGKHIVAAMVETGWVALQSLLATAGDDEEDEEDWEPVAEVLYEALERFLGTVTLHRRAPEHGERAYRVECAHGAVLYWDTGNSWCAIMEVLSLPGEEDWAQQLIALVRGWDEEEDEGDACSVPCSECETPVEQNDPYYATPCGTFCGECMDRHIEECGICRSEFR